MKTLRRQAGALALVAIISLGVISQAGCGPSSTREVKADLNKAAATLNTAAKENRTLYQSHVYGIEVRKKIAAVIGDANDGLLVALNVARNMTPGTFGADKAQLIQLIGDVATGLASAHFGNARIDLLIQAAAATVNAVLILVSQLKSADLEYVVPEFRNFQLDRIAA